MVLFYIRQVQLTREKCNGYNRLFFHVYSVPSGSRPFSTEPPASLAPTWFDISEDSETCETPGSPRFRLASASAWFTSRSENDWCWLLTPSCNQKTTYDMHVFYHLRDPHSRITQVDQTVSSEVGGVKLAVYTATPR